MRAVALLISCFAMLSTAGCLDANVDNGVLQCSDVPGRACPRNYYCANNHYCYRDGQGPGTGPRDLSMSTPPIFDFSDVPPLPPDDLSSHNPPPSD